MGEFAFRVDYFLKGFGVQESKQKVTKIFFLVKHGGKSTACIIIS